MSRLILTSILNDANGAFDLTSPPANIDWLHMNNSTVREVIWSVDNQESLDSIAD
jgi:hypothetical protein